MLPLTHFREDLSLPHAAMETQDNVPTQRNDVSSACLCGSRLPLQVRLGLRSRTRPVIEGRWCCSEQCLHARVASFVRRGVPVIAGQHEHHHRIPLGLLLLSQGAISQEQLRFARQRSERTGERFGDILVRYCGVPEQRLLRGIATQWGCSSWDAKGTLPHGMASLAPHVVLRATGMLPLQLQLGGTISVAFTEAPDASAVFALRRIHDRAVEVGIAGTRDFVDMTNQLMLQDTVPVEEYLYEDEAELIQRMTRTIQRLSPVQSRWARVYGMFWVRVWLEPAALAGGIGQIEDVMDLVFHLPAGRHRATQLKPL